MLLKTVVPVFLVVCVCRTVNRVMGHPRPSLVGISVPWVLLPRQTDVPWCPGWHRGKAPTHLWLLECGLVNVLWWSSKQGQRDFTALPLYAFRVKQQLLIHCPWNVRILTFSFQKKEVLPKMFFFLKKRFFFLKKFFWKVLLKKISLRKIRFVFVKKKVEFWMSSIQWAPHYHLEDSLARFLAKQVFANTNLVRTNFDAFNRLCIRLCNFFFHSFGLWECIRADLLLPRWVSNIHVRIGMPSVSKCWVRFCGVVRDVLCSSLVLPFCLPFPGARYVCARSGMLLLLALPILLQRYLGCRSWSYKPFEKYSISVVRGHTINTIFRYCSVGHDCKWLRLPAWSCTFDNHIQYAVSWSGFQRVTQGTFCGTV